MKIIDCHVHPSAVPNYTEEVDHFITHMRAHGIGCMIASDLGEKWVAYPDKETLSKANSRLLEMVRKYPEELFYLVYINPQLDNWREELARHEKSACGVKLWISLKAPGSTDLTASIEVIKAAAERKLPVLIHCFERTDGNAGGSVRIDEIISMAEAVPDSTLIAAHSNGNWRKLIAKAARVPENIFFDVSGCFPERTMVRRLVDCFGSRRVLFGTDAPGRSFGSQLNKVFSANLSEAELNDVLYENARRIFSLPELKDIPQKDLPCWNIERNKEDNFCFAGSSPYWDHAVTVEDLLTEARKNNISELYAASLNAVKSADFFSENRNWLQATAPYSEFKPLAAVDVTNKDMTIRQMENMDGFAGVWVSPYLHCWSLNDRAFDWFWTVCAERNIKVWINAALSDDRFRCAALNTRVVNNDEIKEFAEFAPQNQYTVQGANNLADLSKALPENFLLEYSKLTDGEYLAEKFLDGKEGIPQRLCRGSEYPFRVFDAVDSILQGKL